MVNWSWGNDPYKEMDDHPIHRLPWQMAGLPVAHDQRPPAALSMDYRNISAFKGRIAPDLQLGRRYLNDVRRVLHAVKDIYNPSPQWILHQPPENLTLM